MQSNSIRDYYVWKKTLIQFSWKTLTTAHEKQKEAIVEDNHTSCFAQSMRF